MVTGCEIYNEICRYEVFLFILSSHWGVCNCVYYDDGMNCSMEQKKKEAERMVNNCHYHCFHMMTVAIRVHNQAAKQMAYK